jgi:hypothetical protein
VTEPLATAAPANPPDPPLDRAAAGASTRSGRLLGLVRKLIIYGKHLAGTLQNRPPAETLFSITRCFGTISIAVILARITRGLRIAAALEARLANRPARPEGCPASARAASPRKPRKPRPVAPRPSDDRDPLLACLPTAEEIAARIRRRPVGAVLVDICGDLGITANHPLWREITQVLIENGGSLASLFKDLFKRVRISNFIPPDTPLTPPMPPGWRAPSLGSAPPAGTGPP